MFSSTHFIEYQNNRLYYSKSGLGSTHLLLFHGFGQHSHVFQPWNEHLQENFTIYSFDLFFHGKSTWTSDTALEKADWKNVIADFLKQEGIEQFTVGGFSLGGKFAMVTLECFPEKVNKLFLLAPDGIKTSAWYSLATYPIATRSLFKSMIEKPERFFTLIKIARKLNLVDKGIVRFVENQMNTKEKREQVYLTWVFFRHIKVELDGLSLVINKKGIPVTMIVGKFDKVIVAENMKLLLDKLDNKELFVLEAGHNDLIRTSVQLISGKA
jgi:pimeloyl-ACP methyl ester carboxylesterase